MTPINLEAAEEHRQLFDDVPIAYHETDASGIIRRVNQAECRLLGYAPEELVGRSIREFAAEEQQQTIRDHHLPGSVVLCEYRRSDGNYVWLEIHHKLIEDAAGEVVGIRAALLDVTERVKLEAEIRKQRDLMRFILRSTWRGIVSTDALGNVSMMNPAAERLTGWLEQEALGRPVEKICNLQRDAQECVDLMSCIHSEPVISNPERDFVIVDRAGATQPVSWSIFPISNDDDVIVGATLVVERQADGKSI